MSVTFWFNFTKTEFGTVKVRILLRILTEEYLSQSDVVSLRDTISFWKTRLVLDCTQFRVYSSSERPVFVTLSLFWQLPEEILWVCRLYNDLHCSQVLKSNTTEFSNFHFCVNVLFFSTQLNTNPKFVRSRYTTGVLHPSRAWNLTCFN